MADRSFSCGQMSISMGYVDSSGNYLWKISLGGFSHPLAVGCERTQELAHSKCLDALISITADANYLVGALWGAFGGANFSPSEVYDDNAGALAL